MKSIPFIFAALLCVAAIAQTAPTIDQSIAMKSGGSPKISPDGKWVAYTVTETNWEENAYETEIWLAHVATGDKWQLTNSKKSNNSPTWSPDGKWLAFVSTRDDKPQLYVIKPTGGEAKALTKFETGVSSFKWAPDGRSIVFATTAPDTKADKDRKEKYADYEVVREDYKMTHLYVIGVGEADGKLATPKALTKGTGFSVGSFSFAPDGKRLAYDATLNPDLVNSGTADIYVLNLSDTTSRKLVSLKGPDSNPIWSPDGKLIAFSTTNENEYFFYANRLIATVPADGGSHRVLTQNFDENATAVEWNAAGLWFTALQKTTSHLFLLNTIDNKITRLTQPETLVANQFSFSKDGNQLSFISALPNALPEVGVSATAAFSAKKITDFDSQLSNFKTATREVINWKSTDGATIEGVLLKPADFDPAKKYPLLVVIHGGPTGIDMPTVTPDRYYPTELFVAKGALVLRPNYRGSAGYGSSFRALNVRNLGTGDYADVISGVDALVARGMVDKDRVGAMGWSQGGYISAFITTYSDRFKATSVGAGISNWATYYQNTDITPFTRQYLKATPWSDPEIYQKTSPITYVKKAKTPTLIQHGDGDKRVPIANAYELRLALEDNNVPVRMVVYKGFGHGIDKPKQMRQLMEENLRWFGQWIWGDAK